jgi:menaquinone-dependent protoporphyrinogen oxidase
MLILMKKTGCNYLKSLNFILLCLIILPILFISSPCTAYPRLEKDLIETDCGDNGSTHVLIAYDTIHGSTAEVAEHIGGKLCELGFEVDVRLAQNVTDISAYDAVIIGTAIYKFAWMEGSKNFLNKNRTALSKKHTAYFMLGAAMSTDIPETRAGAKEMFMDPVLSEFPEVVPLTLGLFGGEVNFAENQYNLFEWIVLKILGLIIGYSDKNGDDWRNMDTIDAWTEEFVLELDSADSM